MVSTQHSEKVTLPALREDIMEKVVKAVIPGKGFFQMFVYIFFVYFIYTYVPIYYLYHFFQLSIWMTAPNIISILVATLLLVVQWEMLD